MLNLLVYQAFPREIPCNPSVARRLYPGCQTCSDWRAFDEMSFGAASWMDVRVDFKRRAAIFTEPEFGMVTWRSPMPDLTELSELADQADSIVGFNSKSFDDLLIAQCSPFHWQTDIDLLDVIRQAKFGSVQWGDQPVNYSYRLREFDRAASNRLKVVEAAQIIKAVQVEPAKLQERLFANVSVICKILMEGAHGTLHDHNDGKKIKLPIFFPAPIRRTPDYYGIREML